MCCMGSSGRGLELLCSCSMGGNGVALRRAGAYTSFLKQPMGASKGDRTLWHPEGPATNSQHYVSGCKQVHQC